MWSLPRRIPNRSLLLTRCAPWAGLFLLLIPALLPFLRPGYFWNANDARHDVYFIFEYHRAWQDGILFPRWLPDFTFGYGYPFFNIYAPLAVQVGELLHLLGLNFTAAVKGVFILSILLSAGTMYAFTRTWLGPWAGLVAAIAYVYAPYHLLDMYQRAAMAESFAFIWLPAILWGVRECVQRPRLWAIVGLAVAFAGLLLTSNLVAVLFTPVILLYGLILLGAHIPRTRKTKTWNSFLSRLGAALSGGLLGLGLSAWFWIPALLEFKYVNRTQWYGGYYDFHHHFVYFFQLFSPHWGSGISVPGPDDMISYQLGLVPYLLALAGIWVLLQRPREKGVWEGWVFLGITGVAVWLTTGSSAWVWDRVPGIAFAQFPWRYLMLAVLGLALLAALGHVGRTARWALFAAFLLIIGSAGYLRVEIVEPLPEQGPVGLPALMRFQASAEEMTGVTAFAQDIPHWSGLAEIMVRGRDVPTRVEFGHVQADPGLRVKVLGYTAQEDRIRYWAKGEGHIIVFNRALYPGWTAYIYDATGTHLQRVLRWTDLQVQPPYGLIAVPVPGGEHVLVLRFEDTLPRKVGWWVSGLSLGLLLLIGGWRGVVRVAGSRRLHAESLPHSRDIRKSPKDPWPHRSS